MALEYITLEEMINRDLGLIGTPERDEFEARLEADLQAYHVSEAIKEARKQKNLTQEQLGELMGVKKAQVSRIEHGHNLTLNTITRAFRALGMPVTLSVGGTTLNLC